MLYLQECENPSPLPLLPSYFKSHMMYNSKTDIRFRQQFSRCAKSGNCAPYPDKAPPISSLGKLKQCCQTPGQIFNGNSLARVQSPATVTEKYTAK
jgi:hypothetical protein